MGEFPEMVRISKVVKENYKVKTFFLDKEIKAEPGQFLMVWIPGVGEKPFSLSYIGDKTAITVEKKGKFTKKLFEMNPGDFLGVRGPYGNGFEIKNPACVIAGGCGIASLGPLIEILNNPTVIMGARTENCLMFLKRFKKAKITTDDGSLGFKGFTTGLFEKLLKDKKFRIVYTCGPEPMMKRVLDLCKKFNLDCQASLERYMKCGFGICGQCVAGPFRVCKEGPVFHSKDLKKIREFGSKARLKSGKEVPLKEYYDWRGT